MPIVQGGYITGSQDIYQLKNKNLYITKQRIPTTTLEVDEIFYFLPALDLPAVFLAAADFGLETGFLADFGLLAGFLAADAGFFTEAGLAADFGLETGLADLGLLAGFLAAEAGFFTEAGFLADAGFFTDFLAFFGPAVFRFGEPAGFLAAFTFLAAAFLTVAAFFVFEAAAAVVGTSLTGPFLVWLKLPDFTPRFSAALNSVANFFSSTLKLALTYYVIRLQSSVL